MSSDQSNKGNEVPKNYIDPLTHFPAEYGEYVVGVRGTPERDISLLGA